MMSLAEICTSVHDCVAAAWIDTRTGVLEHHALRDEAFIAHALEAASEVMSAQERPPRMVLLTAHHVHIAQRLTSDPRRALVVICDRSPNLGLAVAGFRSIFEAVESPA